MPYHIVAFGLSDVGLVRQQNEDVWGKVPEHLFYVVADGMGGHQAGDLAASEAVKALCEIVKDNDPEALQKQALDETCDLFVDAIQEVNGAVWSLGTSRKDLKGMGTTICCVQFFDDGMIYAHVGDSRIYRVRDGKMTPLTRDHSLLRELVDMGQLNEHQAGEFYYKNIITKAVGTEPHVDPSVHSVSVENRDIYMMCTDGLSDILEDSEIEEIINDASTVEEGVKTLVDEAKDRGGHDNITVVMMQVHEVHEK